MRSAVLGLELRSGAEGLRFYDPVAGEPLYTPSEGYAERQRAEQARDQEKQARQTAEARVAELEALLSRERGVDQ